MIYFCLFITFLSFQLVSYLCLKSCLNASLTFSLTLTLCLVPSCCWPSWSTASSWQCGWHTRKRLNLGTCLWSECVFLRESDSFLSSSPVRIEFSGTNIAAAYIQRCWKWVTAQNCLLFECLKFRQLRDKEVVCPQSESEALTLLSALHWAAPLHGR